MSINLLYRRPAYVAARVSTPSMMSTTSSGKTAESLRSSKPPPSGVPELLSFDRIISNGTCPPCTLRDFMDYLLHVELSAEHLQFFLWFRGYVQRFDALNSNEKALSPEWTAQNQKDASDGCQRAQAKAQYQAHTRQKSSVAAKVLEGTMFSKEATSTVGSGNPFVTPPTTSHGPISHSNEEGRSPTANGAVRPGITTPWESASTMKSSTFTPVSNKDSLKAKETAASVAHDAFENAGLSQPFTIQPFRKEIEHIIQTYIAEQSPRELNISSSQKKTLLKALEATTHPSAFTKVLNEVEGTLRNQLHPNFIRWAICNGNRPRVIFARGLGISLIIAGILIELLITLSNVGRGWRALGAIALVIGTSTLIAAYKGMCVVLHGLHHRHLRPWELFTDAETDKEDDGSSYNMRESVESVQSANSYEDAPWVVKYQKRNVIRKVFDREVWIQEPALRQIQDMIFLQSILLALLAAGVVTAIFVAVPKGGYM